MALPNTSFSSTAYVPIIKSKKAELDALSGCNSSSLVPLIEVLEPVTAADQVTQAWNPDDVAWVQVLNPEGTEDEYFAAYVTNFFAELRDTGTYVPVITATEEPATLGSIADIMELDERGIVIRIDVEELIDEGIDSVADILGTIEALGTDPSHVDLVVDAGLLTGTAVIRAAVAGQAVQKLPSISAWRNVVLAFSAFPAQLGNVAARETVTAIPREDAAAFITSRHTIDREVIFSDYTVGVPTYGSAPFTPIPNMRYASDTDWYIHRGKERKGPAEQYRKLASDIVESTYYSGPAYSPGDNRISEIAARTSGPGNATTHLMIAVSRHIHVVLDRLATLGEP